MKITLEQIRAIGKGVETEYNTFVELLSKNIITRTNLKLESFLFPQM